MFHGEGFLKEVLPFWETLTKEQQQKLLAAAKEQVFQKGAILHQGNTDCSGLFLVKKGRLRVYILSEGGKEITLYRLLERDLCLFSASCIMKNIQFDLYISAEQDTVIYLLPAAVYQSLMEEAIEVSAFTNELMASRFSDVMWVMEQVLFTSVDKRLANFLLEQGTLIESSVLNITHEEIARHMGSAREVVTRMLKYFQSEGLVQLNRGSITLLDSKGLKKRA